MEAWRPTVLQLIPSYGTKLNDDPQAARDVLDRTARTLQLVEVPEPALPGLAVSAAP